MEKCGEATPAGKNFDPGYPARSFQPEKFLTNSGIYET
jgi:hypothetical protein